MAAIPVFVDVEAFAPRSFTATDLFAAFRDVAAFRAFGAFAFFVVLAIVPPDASASAADPRPESRTHLLAMREVAPARFALTAGRSFTSTDFVAALRAGFLPIAPATAFPRLVACATSVLHPRSERYSCTASRFTGAAAIVFARRTRPLRCPYSPTSRIASSSQHVGSVSGRRPSAYA